MVEETNAEPTSVTFNIYGDLDTTLCLNCGRPIHYDRSVKEWHHITTGKLACE
jgi:hypothetical protein